MIKRNKMVIGMDSISAFVLSLALISVFIFNFSTGNFLGVPGYLWVNLLIVAYVLVQMIAVGRKKWIMRWNGIYTYYICFILLCFASTIYSYAPDASFDRTRRMLIVFVFSICIFQYSSFGYNNIIAVLKSLSWAGFLGTVYLLLSSDLGQRIGFNMGDPNLVAVTFTYAVTASVFLLKMEHKMVYLIHALSTAFAVLMTGSRTGMGLLAVAVIGNIYFVAYQKKWKLRYVILGTVLIILAIVAFFYALMEIPVLYDVLGIRVLSFYQITHGQASVYGETSTQSRALYAMRGFQWFLESPIWGNGINAYPAYNASFVDGRFCFSHCEYVEILSGLGILGFIAYFFPFFRVIRVALKRGKTVKEKELKVLTLLLVTELLLGSIFLVMYYEKQTWILIALLASIVEVLQHEEQ